MINICISSDENYAKHAGVLITSVLTNADKNDDITIFILDGGISQDSQKKILSLKNIKDCEIKFIHINQDDFSEYKDIKTKSYISFASFYRLKLPSLLNFIDRVIYLDCDMTVHTSLQKLYETNLQNKCIGGCLDIGSRKTFRKKPNYINAGMLLLDLKQMREKNIEQLLADFALSHFNKLKYGDQDIINYACKDYIYILNDEWNVQSSNFTNRSSYTNNPKIIHYISRKKPWDEISFSYHRNEYYKYLQLSPWKLDDKEYKNIIKKKQKNSLIAYLKYRPLFFVRPRFYKALILTYIMPIFGVNKKLLP